MTPKSTPSRWLKCVATQGNLRAVVIQGTSLVREMAARHQLRGVGAQGLGEAVMGALMIGSYCKQGERVNLNVRGSGHFSQALIDAYPDGTVRGFVAVRPENEVLRGGEFAPGPWGDGLLSVLRTKRDEVGLQPYIGTVPLVTGHLAKDLTFYWAQSEQVPTSCGLVVNIGDDGSVQSAGGFLVQALPGASQEEIRKIEFFVQKLTAFGKGFTETTEPMEIVSSVFEDTAFAVVEERELKFQCSCSRERVERALTLIGRQQLEEILKETGSTQIKCDFCARDYAISREDLERLISSAGKGLV